MKYFDSTESLYNITEKYPETRKVFLQNGFPQLADEEKRKTFGQALQLDIALSLQQIDEKVFIDLLHAAIENDGAGRKEEADIRLKGLLPCPVRLPLQEGLDKMMEKLEVDNVKVKASLQAASMGLDWIKDEVEAAESAQDLDDLYLSAGFDMFFENKYFGRFIKKGDFCDPLPWKSINADFHNDYLQLKDPRGRYGILAVVPAVFLVNTVELGKRPIPRSWKDLTHPMYTRSLSLPVADFDLFNAILLTIEETYGMDAVAALGRNMQQSLHPAQMVKSDTRRQSKPAITIMPNFFTKMAKAGGVMQAIWPEDGAIISPVFMIAKQKASPYLKELVNFFASLDVAEILSHQGLFPSLHPKIDNRMKMQQRYMWLGWDYINNNNLNERFAACEAVFNKEFTV